MRQRIVGLFALQALLLAKTSSLLTTSVSCIDYNSADRKDKSWDYSKWGTGVTQWQNPGSKSVKICDQFIELPKDSGRCLYDDALMCELRTKNIDIGAAWIDTAGSPNYQGSVYVITRQKNYFQWVTRSMAECHGHKMRVQYYGSQTSAQPSATLSCGVSRAHDSNSNVTTTHDPCKFKSYSTQ